MEMFAIIIISIPLWLIVSELRELRKLRELRELRKLKKFKNK